jgi:uncharacterized protein
MEILTGSKLKVHCYKHNGKIHRTWDEVVVLDETEDYLVCGNNRVKITEADGRSHRTKETAIIFFYKDRWFHITAQYKNNGLYYKADIASPFLIDDGIIKYIDYDLDLKVFPDKGFRVLDRNEYKYHKKIMRYSEDLDIILQSELADLINMKRAEVGPFNKEFVDNYYQEFIKLLKK